MSQTTIEYAGDNCERVASQPRVSVTDFARGRRWREELPQCDVMEVVDRTETAGYLVSPKAMRALVDALSELEAQVEQLSVAAMLDARGDCDTWLQGDELANSALESFDMRVVALKEVLSGD